jgi:hypothetical protein
MEQRARSLFLIVLLLYEICLLLVSCSTHAMRNEVVAELILI